MLAEIQNGNPKRITGRVFKDTDGNKHDVRVIQKIWSEAELKSVGLYHVQRASLEDISGEVTGYELVFKDDKVVEEPVVRHVSHEDALKEEREGMRCTPLQGILTIGEEDWNKVIKYRDSDEATWSQKVIIDSAQDWVRNSEEIAFFQWLLGYTDKQVDNLFREAMELSVG